MTIVLHIGLPKTGSSAIQYGLAMHQKALSERGLHYALDNAQDIAEGGLVTSGNGAPLALKLNPRLRHVKQSWKLDFDQTYVSPDLPTSLVSSEVLASADLALLSAFRRDTIGDREVRIIAFVRDLYGHAASTWMQRIKRNGYVNSFEAFCTHAYHGNPSKVLRTYAEVFGPERMTVIHYDSLQESIFHALLRTLGVPTQDLEAPPRINRSLSQSEIEVLIACNKVHKDMARLSTRISDHLIYKHPERVSHPVCSPRAAHILAERFESELGGINDTFFAGARVLKIGAPAVTAALPDPTPHEEIWADAVEAVGRRLVSVEAQNQTLKEEARAASILVAERDALREQVASLKGQTSLDKLKLEIARAVRRPARRAARD